MNDGLRRRVERASEELAACRDRHADLTGATEDAYWHRLLGREVRGWAEEKGIPCWPATEDGRFQEWSDRYAGAALQSILHVLHETLRSRAVELGLDLPEVDLENPWMYDQEALDRVYGADEAVVCGPLAEAFSILKNDQEALDRAYGSEAAEAPLCVSPVADSLANDGHHDTT